MKKVTANFKYLGQVDILPLLQVLPQIVSTDWEIYTWRQKYAIHRNTQFIPLIWLPSWWKPHGNTIIYKFNEFKKIDLTPVYRFLMNHYPDTVIVKSVLVKLLAGKTNSSHIDITDDITIPHRIHVSIITGEHTEFIVNNETMVFSVGGCYEINNLLPHSVTNKGSIDRINLIVDLMPTTYLTNGIDYLTNGIDYLTNGIDYCIASPDMPVSMFIKCD